MSVTITSFGFAPTQISGCQLWLDGADPAGTGVVPSAGTLSSWADKSGLGNNTTAPTGRHPTLTLNSLNSLSVMTFSGGQNLTGNISLGGTTFTQFALYSNSAVTVGQAYMDSSDGPVGKLCAQNGGGNQFQPGFAYGSTFQTGGGYRLVSTNCTNPGSSSTVSVWFNGTNQNISGWNFYGSPTTAITSVTIGARKDLVYFSGRIAEIIVYNVALTSTQQQQIEGYLAQKWGILSSLPNGVLGKSNTYFTSMSLLSKAGSATVAPIRITPYSSVSYTFAPTQITGCQLWLDGADPAGTGVVPSSGTLTTWTDKSSAGNHATGGVSPTYSSTTNAVSFNGSSTYLQTSLSAVPSNETFFAVFTSTIPTSTANRFNCIIGASGNNGRDINVLTSAAGNSSAYDLRYDSWAVGSISLTGYGGITFNTLTLATTQFTGGQGAGSTYGSNFGSFQSLSFSSSSTTRIGAGNGGDYYNGTINEIIIYNTVLGLSDRQKVESYLAQKWGIRTSLAAAHPGLTTTYFVNQLFLSRASRTIPIASFLTNYPLTAQTFQYTGSLQTFTVPSGITSLSVSVWGAGGGYNGYYGAGAGAGSYLRGTLAVTAGQVLSFVVGPGGQKFVTFAGSGIGNSVGYPQINVGYGGGRSSVQRLLTSSITSGSSTASNLTYTTSVAHGLLVDQPVTITSMGTAAYNLIGLVATIPTSNTFTVLSTSAPSAVSGQSGTLAAELVIAGGGGGGAGGNPGGRAAYTGNATAGSGTSGGGGGTTTAGGTRTANATAGSLLTGGNGGSGGYSGGGGGGYYGGGGGGSSSAEGGGGGGSSWYSSLFTFISGANGTSGAPGASPGTGDTYFANAAGAPQEAGNTNLGNGLIAITYRARPSL
jgi:hypothetical protein